MRVVYLSVILAALVAESCHAAPLNLALKAQLSASSEFSRQYAAGLAADGVIPQMLSHEDVGRAWAVDGAKAGGKGWLELTWPQPVTVAEVIYYGRTSWGLEECWRDYEVRVDDEETPLARGTFEMNAGPQRIPLGSRQVRKLRLDFLSSYGGPNPGAAEVQVYSESPRDEDLPDLERMPHNLAPEATISASHEFSEAYGPRHVADGVIAPPFGGNDAGTAWAANGGEARDGAELRFAWPRPVKVAEVVYYGRTAFLIEECWKDYELYADDATTPLARGTLALGAGPQEIKLEPRMVSRLRLRFTSSYGGPNPGAAEVRVLDSAAPQGWLGRFLPGGWDQPEEDEALARDLRSRGLGAEALVLIKRREMNPSHVYSAACEGFSPGGGLYVLRPARPGGKLKCLVPSPEGQMMDAEVSYDGRMILFSWRRKAAEGYHLWTVNADGSGLRRLTDGPWHDYNPCWLPDGGIAFVSTRAGVFAMCFVTPSGVLYRMDADGGNVQRLSANYVNDFTPAVLPDGRILYSRWEYVDRPAIPIQSLWSLNPDGTGLSVFYGNRVLSPASFLEARPVPGTDAILCTMTAHNGPIRGALGLVRRAEGVNAQSAITNLTPSTDVGRVDQGDGNFVLGPWENPYPLDAERFLASGKGNLYLGDVKGRWTKVLAREADLGYYTPRLLKARPRETVIPPETTQDPEATLLVEDVYQGLMPEVRRGEIRRIAVIEEMAKPLRTEVMGFGFQRPVVSCGATYAAKKVWGYAEVQADGSARFRVPPDKPLYFEALDENGQALQRMRSFVHFMPGEVRSCVGCHESRNRASSLKRAAAQARAAQGLEPPDWGVTNFDYPRHVQPVLDRHCVSCHSGARPAAKLDLCGDNTDWFSVSYDNLTRGLTSWVDTRNGQEWNILQIAPRRWGSPASRLAQVILSGHPDGEGRPRVTLSDAERRRLLTWMDLNVPYYSTYEMAYPNAEGGRRLLPEGLSAKLAEVERRRCASCHPNGAPSAGYVRITHPERNDFLLAPLARSAGGRQSCGDEPVFADTRDPDYQALLALFGPLEAQLAQRPRMDMPGAVPAESNRCLQ